MTLTDRIKSSQFFSQPREQKMDFAIGSDQAGGKNRGWVTMQGEALDPQAQKVFVPFLTHIIFPISFYPILFSPTLSSNTLNTNTHRSKATPKKPST